MGPAIASAGEGDATFVTLESLDTNMLSVHMSLKVVRSREWWMVALSALEAVMRLQHGGSFSGDREK